MTKLQSNAALCLDCFTPLGSETRYGDFVVQTCSCGWHQVRLYCPEEGFNEEELKWIYTLIKDSVHLIDRTIARKIARCVLNIYRCDNET